MSNVTTFKFNNLPVRIVEKDGKPLFVIRDVCNILGFSNPNRQFAVHTENAPPLRADRNSGRSAGRPARAARRRGEDPRPESRQESRRASPLATDGTLPEGVFGSRGGCGRNDSVPDPGPLLSGREGEGRPP